MVEGIPIEETSQTFRDAFDATRKLNLRYIWIDSLCIIQDSEEDWREQSAQMIQVYSNAFINITATHAPDGQHGCFVERDPATTGPVTVRLEWGPNPGTYYMINPEDFQHNVERAPLHKRAWVVQERIMAQRSIHCCKSQLFWECSEAGVQS
ncbi:uncharacterized protein ColSpa_00499 [Colletotrichum spaethianum]|uniref:Heterokaryon incompatibility domain-containing protein n=1 Tax=Colletotrichum spaethianum TaxID=700344 RepID=A0AA37L1N5_9PEZI|nr:uncharacterized protein ColSpa_00499 [Colletotrichum spaethianum]GKT40318.1 hypothetical protein ColSpa_00499 [Colletotrichum spaethianum]